MRAGEVDKKRLFELLWGAPAGPRRGPRPTLSPAAVARAGIAVADADGLDGLDGLTMQRVAESLGVTKMALYRYVPGRAELVALMLDEALGDPPPPPAGPATADVPATADPDAGPGAADIPAPAGGGWRAQLDDWTRRLVERFRRHPWAQAAAVGARLPGPNELSWVERVVAALAGTGLTATERLDVATLLVGHARNLAALPPDSGRDAAFAALVRGRETRFPALATALATPAVPSPIPPGRPTPPWTSASPASSTASRPCSTPAPPPPRLPAAPAAPGRS
ncbi:TetR/AcrR family transcriptional regulator [Micromonospora robiginosa]|uniref:TetR/AcrR family transcriptional regulator n=1 Tax=Micromonospora robiginosa TaxID=2749844 RepID=A0AAF0P3E7_9ACTN|nr:TetR/AcrR family transcriptional regulator C-terminal domain-containing protein [Micromonospora ferruginea]WMF04477.1 TetR/AcrR family transcriptional regulator [Micromonospora ferruginea]